MYRMFFQLCGPYIRNMALMCIPRHTFNFQFFSKTKVPPKGKNTIEAVNVVSAFQAELKVRMSYIWSVHSVEHRNCAFAADTAVHHA